MSTTRVLTTGVCLGVVLAGSGACARLEQSPQDGDPRPEQKAVVLGSNGAAAARNQAERSETLYRFGTALQIQNLTVWPVWAPSDPTAGVFVSLADAERRREAEVREKGKADLSGAEVGQLVVENRGTEPILICAGTVLKGGKQDRQVARDHVIGPGMVQPLEAFCIEQGRWTALRDGESTVGKFTSTGVIANKRVRASAQYLEDQSAVWANVSRVNAYAEKAPTTSTFLATVEDETAATLKRRGELEEAVRKHFDALSESGQGPSGFAYAINGEPLAMRTFASADLFLRHFAPFRKTMCVEAEVIQRRDRAAGREVHTEAASAELMLEMLEAIDGGAPLPVLEFTTWRILRLSSNRGGRSALWVRRGLRAGEAWVELTTDWTAPVEYEPEVRRRLKDLRALGYTH